MGRHWIFQQDNDPKHITRKIKKLFSKKYSELLDQSSNSLNLNPIENLCSILKKHVKKEINKLVIKKKLITIDIFIDIIKKKQKEIKPKILLNLVHSILKKLKQIIKGNGNKLSY